MFLSAKTVANNVSNILAKLQLAERGQAIVAARDAGLGRRPTGNRKDRDATNIKMVRKPAVTAGQRHATRITALGVSEHPAIR